MIKKSHLKSSFHSQLGVHSKFGQKDRPEQYTSYRKASNKRLDEEVTLKILAFYNSDDNSIMLHGVRDVVTVMKKAAETLVTQSPLMKRKHYHHPVN